MAHMHTLSNKQCSGPWMLDIGDKVSRRWQGRLTGSTSWSRRSVRELRRWVPWWRPLDCYFNFLDDYYISSRNLWEDHEATGGPSLQQGEGLPGERLQSDPQFPGKCGCGGENLQENLRSGGSCLGVLRREGGEQACHESLNGLRHHPRACHGGA